MKDLVILGAGPGGYELALEAKKNNLDVLLIEEDKIGGTCLNRGCIPTKVYYQAAKLLKEISKSRIYGINVENVNFDLSNLKRKKDEIVNNLNNGIEFLLAKNNIEIIKGHGTFIDNKKIKVNEEIIEAKYIVIATGSSPITLKSLGDNILTSDDLLEIDKLPKSLAIIGGGVIGIEMAGIFSLFGVDVSVYEMCDTILPNIDSEIAKRLTAYLKNINVKIHTKTRVNSYTNNTLYYLEKNIEKSIEVDCVVQTIGRKPNLNIGLENTSILFNQKGIIVDDNFRTNIDGVYAIGDVTGKQMLAHVATFSGFQALKDILSSPEKINFETVPNCVFSFPEVAEIGLNEAKCLEKGLNLHVSKAFYRTNGKANTLDEIDGFIKIVAVGDEIVGASIIGYDASTLIHEFVPIINNNISIEELKLQIHAHPTLSEIIMKAILEL